MFLAQPPPSASAGSEPSLERTQQTGHLVRLLLLDGLVVQSLEENVQHQDVVAGNQEK